jgi:hypothetical protein
MGGLGGCGNAWWGGFTCKPSPKCIEKVCPQTSSLLGTLRRNKEV